MVFLLLINKFLPIFLLLKGPRSARAAMMPAQRRYCEKTQSILYGLYIKSRDREIPIGSCLGCGFIKGEWKEDGVDRFYCNQQCQEIYHTLLKPLGGKRLLEKDRAQGEKAVDFPQFLKLLELVDESMAPTIIQFAYPNYTQDIKEMRIILDLRTQSKQLKDLIERYLLRPVERLGDDITYEMTNDEVLLFPNLKHLSLIDSSINNIGTLTRLEKLYINDEDLDGVDDSSIENLVQLKSLTLRKTLNINYSLSKLTNLQILVLDKIDNVTDTTITQLSTTLRKLIMTKVTSIHDSSLSKLTNITELSINHNPSITDSGILPLRNLTFLRLKNCELIESHCLSRMNQLTQLVVKDCQRFTATGFALGVPLNILIVKRLYNIDETTFGFMRYLDYLQISETNFSDKSLRYATNLRTLRLHDAEMITNDTLSRLTNLNKLTLAGNTPNITRDSLRNLTMLEKLSFHYSDIKPDTISLNLTNLSNLSIIGSMTITNQDLPHFTALTYLNISNNKMIDGSTFIYLNNLTTLQLDGLSIVKGGFIASLSNLETISLERNTSFDGKYLRNLPKLKTIHLYDGTISNNWRDVDRVRDATLNQENEVSEIF